MLFHEFLDKYLTVEESEQLRSAKFGNPVGIGTKPAVIVIDVQNYMAPPKELPRDLEFPSNCGEAGALGVERIATVLEMARSLEIPIFHTQFILRPDGKDIGVYGRKRSLLRIEGWCLEGSLGADFVAKTAPLDGEIVLVKKKPSAFFGTPLLGLLIDRGIDSLIVMGGSTSNCVRATVVDAMSFNYRVTVVSDAVFDRVAISHHVALFDMQRQYADVADSGEVIAMLNHLGLSKEKPGRM